MIKLFIKIDNNDNKQIKKKRRKFLKLIKTAWFGCIVENEFI